MKLGLFVTLLVLVASANVFAQEGTSTRRPTTIIIDNGEQDVRTTTAKSVEQRDEVIVKVPTTAGRRIKTQTVDVLPLDETVSVSAEEHRPTLTEDRKKFAAAPKADRVLVSKTTIDGEHRDEPLTGGRRIKTETVDVLPLEETTTRFAEESRQKFGATPKIDQVLISKTKTDGEHHAEPMTGGRRIKTETVDVLPLEETASFSTEEHRPTLKEDRKKGKTGPKSDVEHHETTVVNLGDEGIFLSGSTPVTNPSSPQDVVLISGSITVSKSRPYFIDSVGYEIQGGRLTTQNHVTMKPRLPSNYDLIAPESRVVLYVSAVKTTDPRLAFANFSIPVKNDHFPLSYNVRVLLPREQRGLVESADLTLYLYAYVTHAENRVDTFLPDGTSQVLLQGTNRVVQHLQVNVKANGVEVKGLFRGRYGQRLIHSGTSFQVLIVPESSLNRLNGESMESVAQALISNVPDMYPVPFSVLVPYQQLSFKTRYYAIGYIFENGVSRIVNRQPIFVINENKVLVTPEVTFIVAPHPFILRGTVVRAMPSPFYLEPGSSIIISLHEIDSDSPPIPFRLPVINQLPQDIQVNVSQASRFDPTKNYEILVTITDSQNRVYMTSAQKILLTDQFKRLILPVEDSFYYVQVRLHSSSSQPLSYIRGSEASLIITENPDVISKPIFHVQFDPTAPDFHEYMMKIPITTVRRYSNAYLILLVNNSGILTHVSKILLISNNQPPALRVELPVISLNLIRGAIYDIEDHPAQWSASSYVNVYLRDNKVEDAEKAIVQVWKVHSEREFPIRFEVQVDFGRLLPGHNYSLSSSIETSPNVFEYRPANEVPAIISEQPIQDGLRLLVKNVKKRQIIRGLIYINDVEEPLPANSEILLQLSSTPSLGDPKIIHELRLKVDNYRLPMNFTLELPLDKIDINSVYYFLVQYVVGKTVIVPITQAFAFSPRNEETVVLRLSKSQQIRFTGQVASTGGRLVLPAGSSLHLYVSDHPTSEKSMIYSEVFLQASTNGLYQFTMYLDSVILQRNITLYFRADILYKKNILLSIPRPPLLQITLGGEWNINLVIDLPTLLTGEIVLLGDQSVGQADLDAFIQVIVAGTETVVENIPVRLGTGFPHRFRVEVNSELFVRYERLEARALIKNCREEILFQSAGTIGITARLNVDLKLPIILANRDRLKEMIASAATITPLDLGQWQVSLTGVVPGSENALIATVDNRDLSFN